MKISKEEIAKNRGKIISIISHLQRGVMTKNTINFLLEDEDIKNSKYTQEVLKNYLLIVKQQILDLNKECMSLFAIDLEANELKVEDLERSDEEWI